MGSARASPSPPRSRQSDRNRDAVAERALRRQFESEVLQHRLYLCIRRRRTAGFNSRFVGDRLRSAVPITSRRSGAIDGWWTGARDWPRRRSYGALPGTGGWRAVAKRTGGTPPGGRWQTQTRRLSPACQRSIRHRPRLDQSASRQRRCGPHADPRSHARREPPGRQRRGRRRATTVRDVRRGPSRLQERQARPAL